MYDAYADAWSIIHRNMERKRSTMTAIVDGLENATLNSRREGRGAISASNPPSSASSGSCCSA
jgi:hypothetical protein